MLQHFREFKHMCSSWNDNTHADVARCVKVSSNKDETFDLYSGSLWYFCPQPIPRLLYDKDSKKLKQNDICHLHICQSAGECWWVFWNVSLCEDSDNGGNSDTMRRRMFVLQRCWQLHSLLLCCYRTLHILLWLYTFINNSDQFIGINSNHNSR